MSEENNILQQLEVEKESPQKEKSFTELLKEIGFHYDFVARIAIESQKRGISPKEFVTYCIEQEIPADQQAMEELDAYKKRPKNYDY